MVKIPDDLISVARGRLSADLVLADARVINVFTGEIEHGDVAIYKGLIAGRGRLVAAEGKALFNPSQSVDKGLTNTVHIRPFTVEALRLKAGGETAPVIEIVPGQIITRKRIEKVRVIDGIVVPDIGRDILKLVVVERHRANGNIGVGLVMGFGLKWGALASSIAHDSHNIVAVGAQLGSRTAWLN